MAEKIPKWLNNSFLEKVLKDFHDDESLYLKSFDVVSIMNDRDKNYWCDKVKLTIDYTNSQNALK
jgi:membrane-bound inhibitor of C-type lysozyme